MILGLTATPKDQVDWDTFEFFNCPPGDPTFKYDLNEAVKQGYLVPPMAKQIDVGFIRRGIRYDDLSEEEKRIYEETFEAEYGYVPSEIPASEINERLFNKDTIAKVLAYTMENGIKVKDRIGKTIIFARNISHAKEIVKVFYKEYPHHGGVFCQAIYNSDKSEDLIDQFKIPDNSFRIAVSVDMLDTGIDVPEIVNLVFFKPVFSKSKFWQMVGRGTRLRQDLFGTGEHKKHFKIFDFCRNIDFFSINEEGTKTYSAESLSTRLFKSWIRLAEKLKEDKYLLHEELQSYRSRLLGMVHYQILQMLEVKHSVNVRKRLKYIVNYEKREAWDMLTPADVSEIFEYIAPIVELGEADYDAKVFDQFIHQMQLELLKENPEIDLFQRRLAVTSRELKKIGSVAVVRAKMPLIDKLMDPKYVSQLNVTDLELVRLDIRELVRLIETKRKRLYNTNFTDAIEAEEEADLGLSTYNYANYDRRLDELLEKHRDHLIIHKIHTNDPITAAELKKLEELLLSDMDEESRNRFKEKMKDEEPLGVLIRNFIGMEESAARKAFVNFSRNGSLSEPQKRFISQIIQHLTNKGIVDTEMLYDSPYKEINDQGLDGVFNDEDATKIVSILERIRSNVVG
jgi:type I restriction enzyme R subunit